MLVIMHIIFTSLIVISSFRVYNAFRKNSAINNQNTWKRFMPFLLVGQLKDPKLFSENYKTSMVLFLIV